MSDAIGDTALAELSRAIIARDQALRKQATYAPVVTNYRLAKAACKCDRPDQCEAAEKYWQEFARLAKVLNGVR